jgi:hypothetical protein
MTAVEARGGLAAAGEDAADPPAEPAEPGDDADLEPDIEPID